MKNTYKISSSIASKLKQIKQYMEVQSVTAFVGAGFSLNAEIPSNVKMKTWTQLRETFLDKLYGDNDEEKAADGNDVVRLSSLVDAQFGHNELDNILESALPDTLIHPGTLHNKFVQLPWKDILTTNYDTLIERAASKVATGFKLVTNKETLLYRPSPRIIKLHGSFPNIRPYIMTQEDFRRYPFEHPEMVNTARQCFLESLVCLIGFSGEDPNFRAWIGWLKDVMGQKRLCPTYLITYNKGFHDAEKALLAKTGIDIVNLAEVEGINGFRQAYEFFFDYLKEKATKWSGRVEFGHIIGNDIEDDHFPEYISKKIEKMRSVRLSYPGWMILPKSYEKDFEDTNHTMPYLLNWYNRITDDKTKIDFLYEINWRLTVASMPKNLDWFLDGINDLAEKIDSFDETLQDRLYTLQLSLLEIYRYTNAEDKFFQLCDGILKKKEGFPVRSVYYQQTLFWLARYDVNKVNKVLLSWDTDISDYQNCLQKANILHYIGNDTDAYSLLVLCEDEICKNILQKPDDYYARSCLYYIQIAINQCNTARKNDTTKTSNDKFGETIGEIIERISSKVYEKEGIQTFSKEHRFGIDDYAHSWTMESGFATKYLYPYKLWAIKEKMGVSMFQFSQKFSSVCIQNMALYSWSMAWYMMISADEKTVEQSLGRRQLELIPEDEANKYFDTYISLLEDADNLPKGWARSRIVGILPVVLGRLCTRVSEDRVLRYVKSMLNIKSRYDDKILNNAYDCLDNKGLSVVWELLLSEKPLQTRYNRFGYGFPDRQEINFAVTDKIVNRIVDGLNSDEKADNLEALISFEILWDSKGLADESRNIIANAVKDARSKDGAIEEFLYTYLYVEAEDNEKEKLQRHIEEIVDTFCNKTNYKVEKSSQPLTEWYSKLSQICSLRNFLSEEQKKKVLLRNYGLIEQNKTVFEKEDSEDFFGGMRRFTSLVVRAHQEFLISISLEGLSDKETNNIKEQTDWLISKEFHCLSMKVKVSSGQQQDNIKDIEDVIKRYLFSKNSEFQSESIKAVMTLKDCGGNVQGILDYIFTAFSVADSNVYKNILILFANLIIKGYTENDYYKKVLTCLNEIYNGYETWGTDICDLTDVLYYTNYVSGILSVYMNDVEIPFLDKEDVVFNDVVLGYDKGQELAKASIDNKR